jgi:hypothetical protein
MPEEIVRKPSKTTLSKVKKKLWVIFSLWRRMDWCLKTTGSIWWGFCATCNKRYHLKMLQCGHFVSGRHNGNLFSEKGTAGQCYNCNINLKGNTLEFRRKVIQLYGEGADLELEAEARKIVQFSIPELEEKILYYKQKTKELEEQNKTPELLAQK